MWQSFGSTLPSVRVVGRTLADFLPTPCRGDEQLSFFSSFLEVRWTQFKFHRLPHIHRSDASIWSPQFCFFLHHSGRRDFYETVDKLDATTDADIGDRQHIRTTKIEDKKYVDGPCADPGDARKRVKNIFIRHLRKCSRQLLIRDKPCREIVDRACLRVRKSGVKN